MRSLLLLLMYCCKSCYRTKYRKLSNRPEHIVVAVFVEAAVVVVVCGAVFLCLSQLLALLNAARLQTLFRR